MVRRPAQFRHGERVGRDALALVEAPRHDRDFRGARECHEFDDAVFGSRHQREILRLPFERLDGVAALQCRVP